MSVGGLKPHVLGELDLGICFNLSIFDILSWKLQKLALSVWAWNFVSFFSIFCSNHSGTLFSLGVSACSWRTSVLSLASWWSWWGKRPNGFIILALSAGAADTNSTGIAGYSQNTSWKHVGYHEKIFITVIIMMGMVLGPGEKRRHKIMTDPANSPVETGITFITPFARQFWQRRKCVRTLASPPGRLAKQGSWLMLLWLTRSVGSKVSGCQVGIGHCFNRALMPVSLQKLDIQCMHAWYKDKPFQKLEKTGTNKYGHTHTILFTPFRPKSLDCCAIYIALRLRRHGYQQVHEGRLIAVIKEIWDWERCDAVVIC